MEGSQELGIGMDQRIDSASGDWEGGARSGQLGTNPNTPTDIVPSQLDPSLPSRPDS